jgi:hypothetical protein
MGDESSSKWHEEGLVPNCRMLKAKYFAIPKSTTIRSASEADSKLTIYTVCIYVSWSFCSVCVLHTHRVMCTRITLGVETAVGRSGDAMFEIWDACVRKCLCVRKQCVNRA